MNRFRKASSRFYVFITWMAALIMVVSAWGGFLNPEYWWLIAITGLGFPILFILNGINLIVWSLLRKRILIVPLVAILLISPKLPLLLQWNKTIDQVEYIENQSETFKVMSFNVRLFDLYNWIYNYSTREQIFTFLVDKQPDIICFQEYYSSERDNMNNTKVLPGLLNVKYSHIEFPISRYTTDHYGIATFTKYPIINKGMIYLDQNTTNICIYSDVVIQKDTVRIYNCHLQSVRFAQDDYKFIEEIGKGSESHTFSRTWTIITRLRKAFIKRAQQAELIARHISESPYPVILCGDFNDTALSYSYKLLSESLSDSFRESGKGLGSTYAGPIPGLRIDYILHSKTLTSFGYKTYYSRLSDHYPIETKFVIRPEKSIN